MKELKKLENPPKSKGAVIFAYNNPSIDYVALAEVNARLIKKHLGLPTTLITDQLISSDHFDNIIIVENNEVNERTFKWYNKTETVNWRNIGRYDVIDLTPYDRTILLDADYIVATNELSKIIDSNVELSAFKNALDVTGRDILQIDEHINFNSLEMYWATVIVFDKTEYTKKIFSLMKSIKENWEYYRDLYNFQRPTYRNDFSFTIAVNSLEGFSNSFSNIPWGLPTLGTEDCVEKISDKQEFIISYNGYRGNHPVKEITFWPGDLHVMNKKQISTKLLEELL